MLKDDEGVFPNVDFGFARTHVVETLSFNLMHKFFLVWEAID